MPAGPIEGDPMSPAGALAVGNAEPRGPGTADGATYG
jgi:hypothetical protein